LKVAGFLKTSLIDYPGKISSVVFTQGCNFRCPFCHNPELIEPVGKYEIAEEEIFDHLAKRRGLIEGITITGGEPLLQPGLEDFINKAKSLGLAIKLDTNGSNATLLKKLLEKGLLDYIAMDIKTTIAEYPKITGVSNQSAVRESVKVIMNGGVEYEFRTTVMPRFHSSDTFFKIGEDINGANKYFIQNFRPENTLDKNFLNEKSFTVEELKKIRKIMKEYVHECEIRDNI